VHVVADGRPDFPVNSDVHFGVEFAGQLLVEVDFVDSLVREEVVIQFLQQICLLYDSLFTLKVGNPLAQVVDVHIQVFIAGLFEYLLGLHLDVFVLHGLQLPDMFGLPGATLLVLEHVVVDAGVDADQLEFELVSDVNQLLERVDALEVERFATQALTNRRIIIREAIKAEGY